jgi:hypothetical protein
MYSDLIKAYCKACDNSWTMMEACNKAVRMPAPRFYITPKQARTILAPMMRGDFERVDLYDPLKRKMYYELFDVVMKLTEKREFIGKSLSYIMKHAVAQPAPKFFISPTRARIIRGHIRNGVFDEDGKVIDEKLPSYPRDRERKRKKFLERKKWMLEKMSQGEKEAKQ